MNYSIFQILYATHAKANVLRIPKMWYFFGVRLFKGELLAVKVESSFEKQMEGEGGVTKKDTAII